MNKLVLALTTVLISGQVFAAATLRVPIQLEDDGPTLAQANSALKAKGLELIPAYLEISSSEDGYKKMKAFQDKVAAEFNQLGSDYQNTMIDGGLVPAQNDQGASETCYTGNALEVPDIVGSLTDIFYSDQLTMFALKYKNTAKSLSDNLDLNDPEMQKQLNQSSSLWKNWSGKNDDLLILSSVGDDGDDTQESLIHKCH